MRTNRAWPRSAATPDRSGRRRRPPGAAKLRLWAARALFETAEILGADMNPAALAVDTAGDMLPAHSSRPLTAAEAMVVRQHADTSLWSSSRSVAVALAFGGGTSGEIARVRVCDVNTDAGTVRFWGAASRTNRLDDWGCETIDQDLRERHYIPDPLSRLCVSGPLTPERAAHSVTLGLRSVLHDAALGAEPDVSPRSIRLHTALKIAHQQGIHAAAAFLGNTSLDRTAAALRWHPDHDTLEAGQSGS